MIKMKRKTFDALVSLTGLGLTIVLLSVAFLLNWGYSFANNTVSTQLKAQQIVMPVATHNPNESARVTAFFKENGGKSMLTGKQAQMYADHYIAFHLSNVAGGKTYSEVSALAMANPNDAVVAGQVATLFKGETLRSILLTS
jgi:hypothetical protein